MIENNLEMEDIDKVLDLIKDMDVDFYKSSVLLNGKDVTSLIKIDERDLNGGNFVKPIDAIEIDTTNYTLDEVYEIMINEINKSIYA